MEYDEFSKIIADKLKEYEFRQLSVYEMKNIWMSFEMHITIKPNIENVKRELEILKLMDFLKKNESIKISKTKKMENLIIEDEDIIEAIAQGIKLYYVKIIEKLKNYFVSEPHDPNITEEYIIERIKELEDSLKDAKYISPKGNSFIGEIAGLLYVNLNHFGVFTSGKNSQKTGISDGIAKEYACVFDILQALKFDVLINPGDPDTNSTKYIFIKNCIDYFEKKS